MILTLNKIFYIDFLFISILWSLFINRFLNLEIYQGVLIYSIFIILFLFFKKPFFRMNIFNVFVIYIILRMMFNFISLNNKQILISLTPTLQIIFIFLFVPFLIKLFNKHSYKIEQILDKFNFFAFINNFIVILTLVNIFIFPEKYYEIYGARHFGILSDQLPWITSFFTLYALHKHKTFYVLFYITSLLISGSLNAFIITLFSIFIYLIYLKKINLKYILYTISTVLILLMSNNALIERLTVHGYTDSVDLRFLAYENGIETFKENVIFGHGYGTYNFANKLTKSGKDDMKSVITANTFNQFLQILCDLGIIGFIIYILMMIKIFQLKIKKYIYVKIWILSLMLLSQSSVWILPGSFTYILFILLLSIVLFEDKTLRKSHNNDDFQKNKHV